jgi:hypothetical protein
MSCECSNALLKTQNSELLAMLSGVPSRPLDREIDRLYQLPLDEFTEARNALAKEVASTSKEDAAEVRALQKPSVPAWAINQVYWNHRPAYHALDASAAALRSAHAAVLAGKRADLRAAGKAHEDALEAVLKAALELLQRSGNPVTDATRQAIGTTLRALPGSNEAPGRLSKTLQPGGFELLAGLPAGGGAPRRAAPAPRERTAREPEKGRGEKNKKDAGRAKAIAKAREAVAAAGRAQKTADQNARRDEFEAARTTRDAERAAVRLTAARTALEEAQSALEEAEAAAATAARQRDAAVRRARESAETLATARVRTEAAQADLARAEDK